MEGGVPRDGFIQSAHRAYSSKVVSTFFYNTLLARAFQLELGQLADRAQRRPSLSPKSVLPLFAVLIVLPLYFVVTQKIFIKDSYIHVKQPDKVDFDSVNRVFSAVESK